MSTLEELAAANDEYVRHTLPSRSARLGCMPAHPTCTLECGNKKAYVWSSQHSPKPPFLTGQGVYGLSAPALSARGSQSGPRLGQANCRSRLPPRPTRDGISQYLNSSRGCRSKPFFWSACGFTGGAAHRLGARHLGCTSASPQASSACRKPRRLPVCLAYDYSGFEEGKRSR